MPRPFQSETLPKACAEFRALLEKNGGVSPDSVLAKDVKAERGKALVAMRNSLHRNNSDGFKGYTALSSDKDRAEWLADYMIDPKTGGGLGRNWTIRTTSLVDNEREVWLTEEELGGALYLNSVANAKLAVASLKSRPHENAALRAANVKQYEWTVKTVDRNKTLQEGASVEIKSETNTDTAKEVMEHMAEPRNPGFKPARANKRQKLDETSLSPDEKRFAEAKEKLTKAASAMKATHDKIQRDLCAVSLIEAKLRAKQWDTKGPIDYLKSETEKVTIANASLLSAWLQACQFVDSVLKDDSLDSLAKQTSMFEDKALDVSAIYKKFAKEVLQEFNRSK